MYVPVDMVWSIWGSQFGISLQFPGLLTYFFVTWEGNWFSLFLLVSVLFYQRMGLIGDSFRFWSQSLRFPGWYCLYSQSYTESLCTDAVCPLWGNSWCSKWCYWLGMYVCQTISWVSIAHVLENEDADLISLCDRICKFVFSFCNRELLISSMSMGDSVRYIKRKIG